MNVTAQTNTSKWEGKTRAHLKYSLVQGAQPGLDAQEIFYRSHQAFDFFPGSKNTFKNESKTLFNSFKFTMK